MKKCCTTLLLVFFGLCAWAVEKSETIVYINGSKYYIHTVQAGETLYGLSKTYQVGEQVILEHNPSLAGGLKTAASVKIPYVVEQTEVLSDRAQRRTFDTHFVAKGETLYGIARTYKIPIAILMADNPNMDPIHLQQGERMQLRKKELGSVGESGNSAQWEEYRNRLNSVSEPGSAYHIVSPGETFYSLSHRFGLTEEALAALNGGLKAADLKAGAMIKVPATEKADSVAMGTDHLLPDSTTAEPAKQVTQVEFRALKPNEPLRVALLLPLAVAGDANNNYLEFYQGFLLGLDSVKLKNGLSVHVTLYNTGRSRDKMRAIVESDDFAQTNLIVGPVYEEELYSVLRFAEQRHIPVVSPLANITGTQSEALFQLAPDPQTKYAKVADLTNGSKHVTLIYSASTDKEFEQEMLAQLQTTPYSTHTYQYVHPTTGAQSAGSPSDLTPLLSNDEDNVFIILSNNEIEVERILAALASADTNFTSRGNTPARFVVLGNARWNRYNNIDRSMFFKDRVVFLSTYHAKRDSQAIVDFDGAYIRAFGALPTLYSYRGYDAATLFCPAMYGDIEYNMGQRRYTPLQTSYLFNQSTDGANHVNSNWTRVNYNNDFTITIE